MGDDTHPSRNPLPYERIISHLAGDANSQFSESDRCLRSPLLEEVLKASLDPLAVGVMTVPGVATMCTSHIIRDQLTRATYLDMVTTSVGRVPSAAPNRRLQPRGPQLKTWWTLSEEWQDTCLWVVE